MYEFIYTNIHKHPFHIVDPSPWPLLGAFSALSLTCGGVLYMHNYNGGGFLLLLGFTSIILTMFLWWRDVVREATFEGQHTKAVQIGLKMGMILFILSEVMFFFAFFWAFFHSSLAPVPEIGGVWPPKAISVMSPWHIPFLNTIILLSSGATVTWAHESLIHNRREDAIYSMLCTIIFAIYFTSFQVFEYYHAGFAMSDGVYGSVFFMATGFHGFHVILGTCFLFICLIRIYTYHFTVEHHLGFEAGAWYWHFVDVVWLFLFISIYWWGGS
uniref:Cytochrome c oxidase subunit 3 n=1 Tax=Vischeria sp. CAUP Q 202 TaxID=1805947 RepID=A0A140F2U5_9STRA|nr:cytochrome c oxidase subunit 3 [Vischeria punctata]AML60729.1 cytochrome c oxidase subunit 3 [Vischeria sp. CAUP Q 202]UUA03898.1 cytochrome c oxidase subunit 3 [Vischeria punctata]